jgi:hypothetical protein
VNQQMAALSIAMRKVMSSAPRYREKKNKSETSGKTDKGPRTST